MPIIYNPTDANFLTVAQSRTNNGQRDVRVILDVTSNVFYTLDDDGILQEIQSSGGGEDLAQTLTNGNFTDINDIIMSSGTKLVGQTDVTLYTTDGDIVSTISSISNGFNTYNEMLVDMPSTGESTYLQQRAQDFAFQRDNQTKLYISGRENTLKNENFNLKFPTDSAEYIVKNTIGGDLYSFTTDDGVYTLLTSFQARQYVTRTKVKISAYNISNNKGYYNEITAAFKLDSNGDYQIIGTANSIEFSDFSTVDSKLVENGVNIEVWVKGETSTDINWTAEIQYSDY